MIGALLALTTIGGSALGAGAGSLDRSFGEGGKAVVVTPDDDNSVRSTASGGRGRILTAGSRGRSLELTRLLPDGSADPGFGLGGQVLAEFGDPDAVANDVAATDDGRVLAAGFSGFDAGDSDSYYRFLVSGFDDEGSLDPEYGRDGAAFVKFFGADIANAIAVRRDGSAVVAGETAKGFLAPDDMALAKLTPDGRLHRNFARDGRWTNGRPRQDEEILDVAIDGQGKVVFAGFGSKNGRTHMLAGRMRANRLDGSFGDDGLLRAFIDSESVATTLLIDRKGRPVIAGYVKRGDETRFALARLQADHGGMDKSFGGDGKVTLDPGGSTDGAVGLAPGRGGKLIVVGSRRSPGSRSAVDMVAAQIRADGSLDRRFGHRGWRRIDFDGGRDRAAAAVATGGRILIAGTAETSPGSRDAHNDVAVAALKR